MENETALKSKCLNQIRFGKSDIQQIGREGEGGTERWQKKSKSKIKTFSITEIA